MVMLEQNLFTLIFTSGFLGIFNWIAKMNFLRVNPDHAACVIVSSDLLRSFSNM